MIRYRCQHCAALLVALDRRAGQLTVCKACLKPHQIPADRSQWLDEMGGPLYPPGSMPEASPEQAEQPATTPAIELPPEGVENPALLAPTRPDFQLPDSDSGAVPSLSTTPLPPTPPGEPEPEVQPVAASATPDRSAHASSGSPPANSGAVATVPPVPSRDRALAPRRRRRPPPAPSEQGEPVQLQTQADIAVALTAALSTRMKPRAAPRRDLRLSTAAWMLLTSAGVVLFVLALFVDVQYRGLLLFVGVVQNVVGYAWIIWLTSMRDSVRGLLCAFTPMMFVYLCQYKYAKLRPLRFFATGWLLTALALLAPSLAPQTRAILKREEPTVVPPDVASLPKLEQLRAYREQRSYDALIKLLGHLAKTDPLLSEDAKDRAAISAELKLLCQHTLTDVRVHAMEAYARWDPEGAREVCLAAVRSPTYEERRMALRLLPQWKDHDTARAVQTLIGRPGTVETNQAKAALEEIGGAPAEQAALALFHRAEDQATRLTAISVLEKVGGAESVAWLRSTAMATDDQTVRDKALAAANAIEARLRVPPPAP